VPHRLGRLVAPIFFALCVSTLAQTAQTDKPLAGVLAKLEGNTLKVSNQSGDPWVEMRIAITERETFDEAAAYVCWGDRLDAKESLTTKLESCVNAAGRPFDVSKLRPRFVAVAAHVPEHGHERSVLALR
jgi:hypothetical protein